VLHGTGATTTAAAGAAAAAGGKANGAAQNAGGNDANADRHAAAVLLAPAPIQIRRVAIAASRESSSSCRSRCRRRPTGFAYARSIATPSSTPTATAHGAPWSASISMLKPGTYPVTVEAGAGASRTRATYDLVVRPRVFRTRRLTVNEAFVTPRHRNRDDRPRGRLLAGV